MKRFTINIDDDLHKRFKLACVQEGIDMKDIVMASIKEFLKRVEPKKKK
jgi:hypothetical protein